MENQWKSTIAPFEYHLRSLWSKYTELNKKANVLRQDVIQMEFDKARLTYECDYLQRQAERWKRLEEGHRRMAITLSERMSSALNILCSTEVCSDGRSIADHMRDAHKKLGLLPEESELKTEINPQQDDNPDESSLFYF